MRKLVVVLVLAGVALVGCESDDEGEPSDDTPTSAAPDTTSTSSGKGKGAGETLKATLTGSAETDPDGAGTATVTLDAEKGEVCFQVTVSNLDAPTGMHIHKGAEGEAGPVVIPLVQPAEGDGSIDDCVTVEASLIAGVTAAPGDHYVNVHTGPFPDGAIRGQLGEGGSAGAGRGGGDGY